jgi:hypothetical protein
MAAAIGATIFLGSTLRCHEPEDSPSSTVGPSPIPSASGRGPCTPGAEQSPRPLSGNQTMTWPRFRIGSRSAPAPSTREVSFQPMRALPHHLAATLCLAWSGHRSPFRAVLYQPQSWPGQVRVTVPPGNAAATCLCPHSSVLRYPCAAVSSSRRQGVSLPCRLTKRCVLTFPSSASLLLITAIPHTRSHGARLVSFAGLHVVQRNLPMVQI